MNVYRNNKNNGHIPKAQHTGAFQPPPLPGQPSIYQEKPSPEVRESSKEAVQETPEVGGYMSL